MIGHLNKLLIGLLFTASCSSHKDDTCEECELETTQIEEPIDAVLEESAELMAKYVDVELVPDAKVFDNPNISYPEVTLGEENYEILMYEGVFTRAEVNSDGGIFWFEPYNYWDDDLEQEVKSEYQMNMTFELKKEQISYLAYTEVNEETNNIKWDYLENLFTVTFYVNSNQKNIPLKFENLGKTDWDG